MSEVGVNSRHPITLLITTPPFLNKPLEPTKASGVCSNDTAHFGHGANTPSSAILATAARASRTSSPSVSSSAFGMTHSYPLLRLRAPWIERRLDLKLELAYGTKFASSPASVVNYHKEEMLTKNTHVIIIIIINIPVHQTLKPNQKLPKSSVHQSYQARNQTHPLWSRQ